MTTKPHTSLLLATGWLRCLPLLLPVATAVPGGAAAADEASAVRPVAAVEGVPSRVAFGSCAKEDKPQPALTAVVAKRAELFIYLGDNIYGDTEDMGVLLPGRSATP